MIAKLRQPASGLTHLTGAALALIGQAALLIHSGSQLINKISLVIYSVSLFGLFLTSGLYHSICSTAKGVAILRKFDHSAIYLLIAGTYTPFCLMAFHGFWKWGLLAIIWLLAVVGIIANIWMINAPRWITAGVYVLMGWLIVLAFREMLASLAPMTIHWLFVGGIIYTLGAVIYSTKRMDFKPGVFGFHEVWHIFVMLGAAAHFVAIYSML